ncbi:MAG: ParB/RepB/Spo0J family partition protein [Rickettsia sp.]|nr:ParB/RepB/Spo0J family partition protein [Rickettsia sp.]
MSKNKVLGTSLSSLIDSKITENNKMNFINIDQIEPDPKQPRRVFNLESLKELEISIRNYGILQPIITYAVAFNKYRIISGERRYRASLMAGLKQIPVIVKDLQENELLKISLIENIQRENLTILEEARAYNKILDIFNYSHIDLANILGKTRSHVSNLIRLLKLPITVQNMLEKGEISYGHARAIIGLENSEKIAEKIKLEKWSVRELEKFISKEIKKLEHDKVKNDLPLKKLDKNISNISDPQLENTNLSIHDDFQYLTDLISSKIAMKVKLESSKDGKGKVSIFFNRLEELEGFLTKLK